VHFTLDAPPAATDEVVELAVAAGRVGSEAEHLVAAASTTNMIARLNPRTHAATGDRIELEVDTLRLHFFDPETGSAIYDRAPEDPAADAGTAADEAAGEGADDAPPPVDAAGADETPQQAPDN
jgi:multiple sugar transport system ATP-binding protein